jgi:hypothetical protein
MTPPGAAWVYLFHIERRAGSPTSFNRLPPSAAEVRCSAPCQDAFARVILRGFVGLYRVRSREHAFPVKAKKSFERVPDHSSEQRRAKLKTSESRDLALDFTVELTQTWLSQIFDPDVTESVVVASSGRGGAGAAVCSRMIHPRRRRRLSLG